MKYSTPQSGFTLVELAVALTIIGLVVAGIMKGGEMLDNARIAKTATMLQNYQIALKSFRETYNAMPGDFTNPGGRLVGCDAAPCNTAGSGNNVIGVPYSDFSEAINLASGSEAGNFWLHLAYAGLITNELVENTSLVAQRGPGTVAFAPVFYNRNAVSGYPIMFGHYILLKYIRAVATTTTAANSDNFLFKPGVAARLDTKMDDGRPYEGDLMAISSQVANCMNGTGYNEAVGSEKCNMLYRIR